MVGEDFLELPEVHKMEYEGKLIICPYCDRRIEIVGELGDRLEILNKGDQSVFHHSQAGLRIDADIKV
jgi:hypothetical protein